MSKEMLDHAESVLSDFCDELLDPEILDVDLDPYTTEEKIIMSREEQGLEPHEISELVLKAMRRLPAFVDPSKKDDVFDILYELVSEAVSVS